MKRKNFIKLSSSLAAGGFLVPYLPNKLPQDLRTNWAGNYTYRAEHLHEPETVEELQKLVSTLGEQKALGSTHCFNNIADSPANQISTRHLTRLITLDEEAKTVTVEGGITYGELAPILERQGYALHNLASLPHISVAGASATATHGSGVNNRNLAGAVVALELVTGSGEVVHLSRKDPQLMISEIRTIAADDLWLSPCYRQDCVAIHFTWKQNWEEVRKLLSLIEAELQPFQVVPHWGKLFTLSPETLHSRYEKMEEFLQLAQRFDPGGKFRNAYLDLNIY